MNQIRQQMESIADSIVRLSEQSQAIGTIISTVDDIAEQSNLLAVNAADGKAAWRTERPGYRRGFSTLLLCEECGATLDCPRCSISLTYHAARGRLCCHTCDFERRPPAQCPESAEVRAPFFANLETRRAAGSPLASRSRMSLLTPEMPSSPDSL